MKKVLITGVFLTQLIALTFGQISTPSGKLVFADTLELRPLHGWILINNPALNIWEVGQPNKNNFTSAHSGKEVIITDSISPYQNNLNDFFTIKIPFSDSLWGEGILSFYHKYETDTLIDGGIIEVSYDDGINWLNVKDDKNHIQTNFIGLYDDTIKGGKYGYSGNLSNWKYVEFYWWWLMKTKSSYFHNLLLKFKFLSDAINTNKAGWMIDDIVIRCYSITGTAEKLDDNTIKVFPNPTKGLINIAFPESIDKNYSFEIYDIIGKLITKDFLFNQQLDISNLKSGLYFLKLHDSNNLVFNRKIMKY